MNITAIGELRPHPDVPEEWLVSAPVPIQYFDGLNLAFTLDGLGDADEQEATAAIESFLRLGPNDRLAASNYVYQNYTRIANLAAENDLGCRIDSADDVWKHVRPSELYVSRRQYGERAIYVQITANFDWDREHGLQIVYRRGSQLSRVSEFDGHLTHSDAYDLPEDQDRIV